MIAAFIALRVAYVRWIGVHDYTWGPFDAEHRRRALHSVGIVASTCLRMLLAPGTWGVFWPAFFAAALLVASFRRRRVTLMVLALLGAMGIDAAVFLFTNWDIALHIEGAYARLLAQLAPAAAVVIAAAAERIWSPAWAAGNPAA